jgi:hypothetical protein
MPDTLPESVTEVNVAAPAEQHAALVRYFAEHYPEVVLTLDVPDGSEAARPPCCIALTRRSRRLTGAKGEDEMQQVDALLRRIVWPN